MILQQHLFRRIPFISEVCGGGESPHDQQIPNCESVDDVLMLLSARSLLTNPFIIAREKVIHGCQRCVCVCVMAENTACNNIRRTIR